MPHKFYQLPTPPPFFPSFPPSRSLRAEVAPPLSHQARTYGRLLIVLSDASDEGSAVSKIRVERDLVDDRCRLRLYGRLLIRQGEGLQALYVSEGVLQGRHFWL